MLRDTRYVGPRMVIENSILYFWDITRNKYISTGRHNISYGIDHVNISNKRYMKITGNSPSNATGYRILRDAIITAISINTKDVSNCKFNIKKNYGMNLMTAVLLNNNGMVMDDLNISIDKNDWLQAEIDFEIGEKADFPELIIELAWSL